MSPHDIPFDDARPALRPIRGGAIRVGIGGWNFPAWRDNFYPKGLPQRRELEYASRQLHAIEINSTFYGAQKPATYAQWAKKTPDGFVFSLKAPRYVSHMRQLAEAGRQAAHFLRGGIAELGTRLGPIVWQLPPGHRFDRDDLHRFLDSLPRRLDGLPLRHVLEVRHASFQCPAYLALVREQAIPTVYTDSSDYPSLADASGDFRYARLMRSEAGRPCGYSAPDLRQWASRAMAWASGEDVAKLPHVSAPSPPGGPQDVFIFFISAAKERNPAAAMALTQNLARQ